MNLGVASAFKPDYFNQHKKMTLLKVDSVWKLQAVPHSHDLGQEMFLAFERLNLSFKTLKSNFITKGEHQKNMK